MGVGMRRHATPAAEAALEGVGKAADVLEDARDALTEARTALGGAVVKARALGASWGHVGDVLRVSRQAAQERFGALVPPRHCRSAGCTRRPVGHLWDPEECPAPTV